MMDWLTKYVVAQTAWSRVTFGSSRRTVGICRHIEKELVEIQADPDDAREWIDVMILAIDGYWRHGGKPEELAAMLEGKQRVNFEREWPPIQAEDQPTEHVK